MTSEPLKAKNSASWLTLRSAIWISVMFGIFVSGYLSYIKLTNTAIVCVAGDTSGCETVQTSIYAEFMGIPIAYLGLAMYLVLAAVLLLEKRIPFLADNGTMIFFGICLFSWMYSMYLVYLQGFVLSAWCQWCLLHEVNMTILFAMASLRLKRELA